MAAARLRRRCHVVGSREQTGYIGRSAGIGARGFIVLSPPTHLHLWNRARNSGLELPPCAFANAFCIRNNDRGPSTGRWRRHSFAAKQQRRLTVSWKFLLIDADCSSVQPSTGPNDLQSARQARGWPRCEKSVVPAGPSSR
jgi:hypothetical protein